MKFMKRLFKDSKGLSLIELIVTIAIMSVITVGIGAAVISATNNYNRGTTEVNVQATGQNVTNILTNLIIDSAQAYSEADGVTQAVGPKLFIKDVNGTCVCVRYVPNVNPNGTGSLFYGEASDYVAAEASTLVLAENVTGFEADTTKYKDEYTVHINLELSFPSENREFKSSFTVTSRNAAADGSYIDNLDSAVIISDTMVMVEPNESSLTKNTLAIDCKVMVSGSVTDNGITYLVLPNINNAATALDNINGSCGLTVTYDAAAGKFNLVANENLNSSDGKIYVRVSTTAIDPSTGLPYDTKWITVYVRRVTEATITKDKTLSTKDTNQAGSVHVIEGNINVSNGGRNYALSSDSDYDQTDSSVYDVVWTASVASKSGYDLNYFIKEILDEKGTNVTSQVLSSSGYMCKAGDTLKITLKNQLPKGDVITFTLTPMHPQGIATVGGTSYVTNKASLAVYNGGAAASKSYPCSPALYKITSGFFDEISDYQRGTVLNRTGFGNVSPQSIYDEIFKGTHDQYKLMNQNSIDSYGNKVADVNKWLEDFRTGKVAYQVGYFYRIKDYTKDIDGNQLSAEGWSQFRDMTSSQTNFDFNKAAFPSGSSGQIYNGMTNRLNADTYQAVEFVVVLYDAGSKKILWPAYDALEEYGFGDYSSHCGIGWSINSIAASVTEDYSTYATTFDIVPARIEYYGNGGILGVGTKENMVGTTSNPTILGDGLNDAWIEYEQGKWVGLDYKEYQQRIAGVLMKNPMDGSGWKQVAYFGEPGDIPQKYECAEGGFKVGSNNHSFTFDTQNISAGSDYDSVYRVAPIIYKWKLAYIKEEDQVWSKVSYYDEAHTYTYLLSSGQINDDPLNGSITFRRYGAAKTIQLELNGEGATCSQSSVSFVAGKGITLPTPSRTGYAFAGWYTAATGGELVPSGSTSVTVSKLWAQWIDTTTNPVLFTCTGTKTVTVNYNGQSVQVTRYTYTVANFVASAEMVFTFNVSSGAEHAGAGTAGVWPSSKSGNEWSYKLYMNKGDIKTIEIDVYNGTITGTRM